MELLCQRRIKFMQMVARKALKKSLLSRVQQFVDIRIIDPTNSSRYGQVTEELLAASECRFSLIAAIELKRFE